MKFNLDIDNIKYIKILYSNSEGNPVSVKAAIKRMTNREIIACIKYSENFGMNVPQNVTLSIICTEGLYRTQTKLKSYSIEDPYIFIFLETPENIEYQQNREFFRMPAAYDCVYCVENNGQSACFDAKTSDISATGVSITLPVHVFSEENAEIEITIEERVIKASIEYIRSEKIADGYKLSFKFVQISDRDQDYISQICIRKQLEERRSKSV